MKKRSIILMVVTAFLVVAGTTACTNSSVNNDQQSTNNQLLKYQKAQPVPQFDYSQYRQTIINVETAEVNGIATTSFMFNQGSAVPMMACPSLGYPIASTAQLTNPLQVINNSGGVVEQQEPNGVYTGTSTGTYVVCVLKSGKTSIDYWEGFVYTVGGPAHWDAVTGQVVSDGDPTVSSSKK
jgi:hypothetical protein